MDADFVEVPRGTLVNITSSLLTVQPTDETLAVDRATSRRAIAGVARVAPQRIVLVLVDGQPANVIAFDPTQDFTVLNWLEVHQPGLISTRDLIVGDRLPGHSAKTSASAASRSAFTVGWPRVVSHRVGHDLEKYGWKCR